MLMLPFTFEETEIESNTSVIPARPQVGIGVDIIKPAQFLRTPEHTSVSVQRDTSVPGTFEPERLSPTQCVQSGRLCPPKKDRRRRENSAV